MARGKQSHRPIWDGTRLARDMMRAGLTQRTLAQRAHVTDSTVSRLINGQPVSARMVGKVAKALGQTADRYLDTVAVDPPQTVASLSA